MASSNTPLRGAEQPSVHRQDSWLPNRHRLHFVSLLADVEDLVDSLYGWSLGHYAWRLEEVRDLLGHSSVEVTQRYAWVTSRRARRRVRHPI